MSDNDEQKAHFALFPFMAQGHLIPMVDIGRLLAKHGVKVTIFTTPLNAKRIEPVISRAIASGLSINLIHLKFPCAEVGLPEGHENMDMISNLDDALKFFKGTIMLKEKLQQSLQELSPFPSCLIADMCFPWANDVAQELHIPRIAFHGTCCFALLCWHVLWIHKNLEEMASDTEYFVVPGLPDKIEMTLAQLRGSVNQMSADWNTFRVEVLNADREAFGTLINGFRELEPEYVKLFKKMTGKKVWCIGPVSLCNKDELDKSQRGNKSSIDGHECLKWLDSKEPSSVLYICLGSLATLATSQLIELGLALEKSSHPFIWVVRDSSDDFKKWILEEKFEEKVKERGLMIRGWAPQVLILSHPSVGGFLTHCGWNSTMEGISYGLPMLTWPVLGEQFSNEKFIVNVIKTGIKVGVELPVTFGYAERIGVQVKCEEIKCAIDSLMDKSVEGEQRRERAKKLSQYAKSAVEEGGSSYLEMDLFIEDIVKQIQSANGVMLDSCHSVEVLDS